MPLAVVIPVLVCMAAACDLAVDPNKGWREVLGYMDFIDGANVTVPEMANAGTPFDVSFNTIGDGCYRGGGTTIVSQQADRVVIEPRDYTPTPAPYTCNSIGKTFQHRVAVRFDLPGTSTVVIRALGQRTHWDPIDTLTVERTIMIR